MSGILFRSHLERDLCEILAPGKLGNVQVEHVEVTREMSTFTALRAAANPGRCEHIPPGRYCHLRVGTELMMSDTPMEKRTNRDVVREARGDVLIAGLGLGMILIPIMAKPEVTSVTVVEKYENVVNLVAPAIQALPGGEKLNIVHGDIDTWRPSKGVQYDTLYFDIWPDICVDNLKQIGRLHRSFRRFLREGGWMDSWVRDELKQRRASRRRGF